MGDKNNQNKVLPNNVNRICGGTEIQGDITTQHDIRIDGKHEGNMKCAGKLVIGETGFLKGAVSCKQLDVWGHLWGKVEVTETASFKAGAVFDGELHTAKLMMDLGVVFNGSCTMKHEGKA